MRKYRYIIDKRNGRIILRSSGTLELTDPATQVVVESTTKANPRTQQYDFVTGEFRLRPPSALASEKKVGANRRAEAAAKIERFVDLWASQEKEIRDLIEMLLLLPRNDLVVGIEKRKKEVRLR